MRFCFNIFKFYNFLYIYIPYVWYVNGAQLRFIRAK